MEVHVWMVLIVTSAGVGMDTVEIPVPQVWVICLSLPKSNYA